MTPNKMLFTMALGTIFCMELEWILPEIELASRFAAQHDKGYIRLGVGRLLFSLYY